MKSDLKTNPIAIIGMDCFFPKSSGLKAYWRLLLHGADAITDVPESHWSIQDYYDHDPKKADHTYCTRGGFLSPVSFDPVEFGIPPASLEATDTSQILALVAAKMALEDAGYGNGRDFERDRTSVILGVTGTQELVIPLSTRLSHPLWRKVLRSTDIPEEKSAEIIQKISDSYVSWQENSFPGLLGNVVAGRIANRLDLGGTNCVVDAACASSMSAIHLAVMELLSGRSHMVVTGGVDTLNDIFMHMCFSKTSVLSPTGDARPFSENADGTVLGEGIGILIIKRLEDAQRDKDRIYAVIKALGSSSDGKSQSIYAPSVTGQAKALQRAYRLGDVDPATVELIEAHGTGTRVGDAVEFKALSRVFGESARNGHRCALGSVKSMIGHTKAAAGAAGLIKAVLSLQHKVLPPTLKADKPDPALQIEQGPFYLNTALRPWISKKEHPRRSGVSAFGFGGSNFHLVLEEYRRDKSDVSWDGSVQIFALSAATAEGLVKALNALGRQSEGAWTDPRIASSAAATRKAFNFRDAYRLLMVYEHLLEGESGPTRLFERAREALETNLKKDGLKNSWQLPNIFFGGPSSEGENQPGKIAFLFPGQGSQYIGMGRDLVCCFPEALPVFEKANQAYPGATLLSDLIYPYSASDAGETRAQSEALRQTEVAQPAIGAISLVMLEVLRRFGLKPDATAGHSFGELTALCAAGWIDAQTLLDLAVLRGRLMASAAQKDSDSEASPGTMLAVSAPLNRLEDMVAQSDSQVVLANRNSPNQGVLSGPVDAIVRAEKECRQWGWRTKRLAVSAAFHSHLIKGAQKPFMRALQKIILRPSAIPVLSNTTGGVYPRNPDKAGRMLGQQLSRPVDFVAEIETLFGMGIRTFIEIGPRTVLSGLVRSILKGRRVDTIAMDLSGGKRFGLTDLAGTLGHLASIGHPVDLTQWEAPVAERVNPQLSIPVLGANFKPRQMEKPKIRPRSMQSEPQTEAGVENKDKMEGPMPTRTPIGSSPEAKQPQSVREALRLVREGLKTMQDLHTQTAEAHQKFLESQSAASRALQAMMEGVRQRWGEVPKSQPDSDVYRPDSGRSAVSADQPETGVTAPPPLQPSGKTSVPGRDAETESAGERRPVEQDSQTETAFQQVRPDSPEQELPEHPEIESALLAVVSDLTGYPVEMLGLDMEIEADLGIDSIKRVEILSALEEKIPHIPALPPEMIGSIKTLGQIVDFLTGATSVRTGMGPAEGLREGKTDKTREALSPESPDNPEIESALLAVVSDLTGYPVEMLGLDMEIEADLGIDSIKRVEILSALEEKIPHMPAVPPEMIGSLKTLGQISAHLRGSANTDQTSRELQDLPAESRQAPSTMAQRHRQDSDSRKPLPFSPAIARHTVSVIEAPPLSTDNGLTLSGGKVYITADNSGLSEAIVAELRKRDFDATIIPLNARTTGVNLDHCAGLIIVADVETDFRSSDLKDALMLSRHAAADLREAARCGGAWFVTITHLDGAFGFKGRGISAPLQGGLAGLVKTAAIEWENVRCRAIDIDPDWHDLDGRAVAIVDELVNADSSGPIEVGRDADARWHLELRPAPYTPSQRISTELKPGDVVVASGGARGITAAAVRALAEHTQATVILLGRSARPSPEPEWLRGLEGEARIKKAIIVNELNGSPDSPAQVEQIYRQRTANREILSNLEQLKQFGVRAQYFSVDVRDPENVGLIFDTVRQTYGPIRAIIHGAGVREDRLIVDKTPEQFDRVFETKVKGIDVLTQATRQDPLKYLVLFSSVAARQGNTGQVDYAMANEVLNKIARQEAVNRPECRVMAINWGPWDGGMVSASLKREFARHHIDLIPLESGALGLLHEMMDDNERPVEVVLGAGMRLGTQVSTREKLSSSPNNDHLFLSFKKEVDIHSVPILGAHVLDGKPVVPFALMTEWLGHGALHGNPGLRLIGIDDMRLLHGIKLEQKKRVIRILAGRAVKKGTRFEVAVELQDGFKDGREVIHSKAKAILSERSDRPPAYQIPPNFKVKSYPKQIDEVYDKILFQGLGLHGIREIVSCLPQGMMARLSAAPPPQQWMKEPLRSRWIGDPLVLDSLFQMAIVWCYEETGLVSLPSYNASYRQYRECFPAEEVTAVLEVRSVSGHKMKGDFTILDADDGVVARLAGYEAVMDESLLKTFKPRLAANAFSS